MSKKTIAGYFLLIIFFFFLAAKGLYGENFLIPLPAGQEWKVTCEAGGKWSGGISTFHKNSGYFSIDFADKSGEDVPVLAALAGKVVYIKRDYCDQGKDINNEVEKPNEYTVPYDANNHGTVEPYGNYIRIAHTAPWTIGKGYETIYAHLKCGSIPDSIEVGTWVARGDVLGVIGNSGASTGPHLHFQVKYNNDSKSNNTQLISSTIETDYPWTDLKLGESYPSTNTSGLEAALFELDFSSHENGGIITLDGGGTITGSVSIEVQNNLDKDVVLNAVSIYAKPYDGNRSMVTTHNLGNESDRISGGESKNFNFQINPYIRDNFMGDYVLDAEFNYSIPSEGETKSSKSGKSDSIFIISDGKSAVVDNHQTDVLNSHGEPLFKMTGDSTQWGTYGGVGFRGSECRYLSPTIKEGMTAVWNPDIRTHGRYDIYMYVPGVGKSNVEHGKYTIFGAAPSNPNRLVIVRDIEVDQKYNRGLWVYLGAHFLSPLFSKVVWTGASMVENDRCIAFDAFKFIYTGTGSDFTDVKVQEWYYDSINKLKTKGIVDGKGNNLYEPTSHVTRAEFLKMAMLGAKQHFSRYMLLESPLIEAVDDLLRSFGKNLPFSDVQRDDWFYPFVALAYHLNIVSGYDSTQLFKPNDPVLRCEALKMLSEAFSFNTDSAINTPINYTDVDAGAWYIPHLKLLTKHGIVHGYTDNTFKPGAPINRAEAAKIVSLAMDKFVNIPH